MGFNFVPTLHYSPYESISPNRPELSAKGKSVLVTGGGYGIGASIARAFAAAGASRLAISGRTESKLKSTAAALTAEFPNTQTSYYVADVTDEAAVASMFESFGTPDILVNNAAVLSDLVKVGSTDDNFIKNWWKGFEINVLGTVITTHHFLRMKKEKKEAVVIIVNSMGAHWGTLPGFTGYIGSKAALLRLSEGLQVEHPEVRFVNVHPGYVQTTMAEKAASGDAPTLNQLLEFTDAEMTANFMLWAASPEADFLGGRFVWANWDVEELKAKRSEILEKNMLQYTLAGF